MSTYKGCIQLLFPMLQYSELIFVESVCGSMCGPSGLVCTKPSKIQVHCITVEYLLVGIIKCCQMFYKFFQLFCGKN